MNHKKTSLTISAAALALALTGCGFAPTEASDEPSSSSSTYTPDDALVDEPADEPTAEELDTVPEDMGPVIAKFGEDWEYEDGMTVKVTAPTAFTPSTYAAGGEGHQSHIKTSVTITNGTSASFDPTLAMDTVTSGGAEGDPVFDDGLEGSPMATLLPGRSITYDVGYGVNDPSDVTIEVSPDWDHEPAIFTADGK